MARKIILYCAYLGCSFVLAVIVIEFGIYLVIRAGWNPVEAPSYDGRIWEILLPEHIIGI